MNRESERAVVTSVTITTTLCCVWVRIYTEQQQQQGALFFLFPFILVVPPSFWVLLFTSAVRSFRQHQSCTNLISVSAAVGSAAVDRSASGRQLSPRVVLYHDDLFHPRRASSALTRSACTQETRSATGIGKSATSGVSETLFPTTGRIDLPSIV